MIFNNVLNNLAMIVDHNGEMRVIFFVMMIAKLKPLDQ